MHLFSVFSSVFTDYSLLSFNFCSHKKMKRITSLRFPLNRYGNRHAAYSTKTAQKIGIIGLGNVGSTVAKNLLKSGFTVSALLDVNPKAGQDLPGNIPRPGTPRELASMCDVVMTALPAPPHVKQVLTGEDGVLAGLRSGGVWIDHSTTDYQQTLELAAEAGMYLNRPQTKYYCPNVKCKIRCNFTTKRYLELFFFT